MKQPHILPEYQKIVPLIKPYINGTLNPDEAKLVANAIKKELKKLHEMVEKYLAGSISGKELLYFRDNLVDTGSPAEYYLANERYLWGNYTPFLIDLSLYEANPQERTLDKDLIGDEELKNSAKAFLDVLNITIDKL